MSPWKPIRRTRCQKARTSPGKRRERAACPSHRQFNAALGRAIGQLITEVSRNLLTIWALHTHTSIRNFRFISNPGKSIKKTRPIFRINFTVREFLVAFGAAQNPSRHLAISSASSLDGKRSRAGLGCLWNHRPIPRTIREIMYLGDVTEKY
jgi:hypothetical protein